MTNFEELLNPNPVFTIVDVYLKIDGECYIGLPLTKDEFIKKFHELETLMLTDDKKYWVLYDERYPETIMYDEIFWYIPKDEIHFVHEEEHGWIIWEESEEYENAVEKYNRTLDKYNEFETNLACYVLYNKRADVDTFKLWKAFNNHIEGAQEHDVMLDNKVCLITWLEHNWNAFLECILNDDFKYINVANIVLESWEEFCR